MAPSTVLAGDIGGTKTLLSLYSTDADRPRLLLERRYPSADWADLAPLLRHFLAEAAGEAPGGVALEPPAAACLAVAGPVQAGRAQLTHLPWRLEEGALAAATGIGRVELVNDFAVLVYAIPRLAAAWQAPIRPGQADPAAPLLIIGAGTGLGVAIGLPTAAGLQAVASEGGHGEFAPRDGREWRLKHWLLRDLGLERLSIERLVSGTGLGHLARWWLAEQDGAGDHPLQAVAAAWWRAGPGQERPDLPAAVAAAAAADDPLARGILDLWLELYGSVCVDLALAILSRGGLWLAGGTAAKLLRELQGERFSAAFLAKGRLRAALEPMPIRAITDPSIGGFAAACRAAMLAADPRMGH
ncbi:MAG: glucokinase [Prochlorococcaceae cyanobacterium]